ncbi:MAG: NAD(P)-dependent oxidoreductase [Deltaproteobacteria bacterium]|jgi:3-hydroxyisobutyrate dehydrogenase/2-hydroxy-3-oxopropionate reductase|nr:NAD(P)-dependent oxidoreductase [Deltaproteobacteria bacterium]
MSNVGIIGVGVMGGAAAEKISQAGYKLWLYDVSPKLPALAAELEGVVVRRLDEIAAHCQIVLMFLPGPDQVKACVTGPDGLLTQRKNSLDIVDLSTVDPGSTERMAKAAASAGMAYLDAPVLGRPSAVGNWALPVGGDAHALERCRPVLQLVARKIMHIGPCGSGNKIKLLNQMMFGAINAMTAEMMAVADNMGIAPKMLYETIAASQAGTVSNLFKELGLRIAADKFNHPTFSVDLLIKDVQLAIEMARQSGAAPILAETVEYLNRLAGSQGMGGLDTAVMWKCLRKLI